MRAIHYVFPTLIATLLACSTYSQKQIAMPNSPGSPSLEDPYIWLEDVHSARSMSWVEPHNQKALGELSSSRLYKQLGDEIRAIVTSKDRIPYPSVVNGMYQNFWQDEEHQRGIFRETTADDYSRKNPNWQTILDIDALNKKEKKSWVFHGNETLPPEHALGLVSLSDGGSDRAVVREFDVASRTFVANGFTLPEGKHRVSWIDKDTLILGTDFGPGTLTKCGYPRQVRLWKRGSPLASAPILYQGSEDDVSVYGFRSYRPESSLIYIGRAPNFFESENSLYDQNTGKITKIPFPTTSSFIGDFHGYLLTKLRVDWKTAKRTFLSGSLVSLPVSEVGNSHFEDFLELVYEPDSRSTLNGVSTSKSYVFLNLLTNVHGRIMMASHDGPDWTLKPLPLPEDGEVNLTDSDNYTDTVLVSYQNFTTPTTLYRVDCSEPRLKPEVLKHLPRQYDAKGVIAEQKEAVSKDGTKVPYFLIHKKSIKNNGSNPTLLYAYGGFEASQTPYYLGALGKVWIERGGVYAIANLRGGGEFGPKWHEAALKEHRQRAYDDFIAASEDLIKTGITSPRHLGIRGGSNGGLLMGVALTQRPDLYRAILCESALLDMLRFHKLPPGASWTGEYGNPDIASEAQYIVKYSPYQNLKPGLKYPKIFFYTSTGDDRVQPSHTRKMVARMEELGNDVLLYENTEGGHGAAADLEQTIKKASLEYSYLFKQLK